MAGTVTASSFLVLGDFRFLLNIRSVDVGYIYNP